MAQIISNGRQLFGRIESVIEARLDAAAAGVAGEAERLMSPELDSGRAKGKRLYERRSDTARAVDESYEALSIRNEDPDVIWMRPRRLLRRVGTLSKEGLYREVGTRKTAANPYLRPALENYRARIQKLFRGMQ